MLCTQDTQKTAIQEEPDWDLIKAVKKELKIPVFGNGDIRKAEDAIEMLKIADAAMIGRAAVKYPKIFLEAKELMKKNSD